MGGREGGERGDVSACEVYSSFPPKPDIYRTGDKRGIRLDL